MIERRFDSLEPFVGHPAPTLWRRTRRYASQELSNVWKAEADMLRESDDRKPLESRFVIAALPTRSRR